MANVKSFNYATQKNELVRHDCPDFRVWEFIAHDSSKEMIWKKYFNGTVKICLDNVMNLQRIKNALKPKYPNIIVHITSAYRPSGYDAAIGGAGGYHPLGQAADIVCYTDDSRKKRINRLEIAKIAESLGVKGIGCYNDDLFNHIDSRANKYYWYNQSVTTTSTFGAAPNPVSYGDPAIKTFQSVINSRYNTNIAADGFYGGKTRIAIIKGLQTEYNKQNKGQIDIDGVWGEQTEERCVTLKLGSQGNITYLMQALLYGNGYKLTVDGAFGNSTFEILKKFQKEKGLLVDGEAGVRTFRKLVNQ